LQTTLLGLAIAFILALIAALVGPYFVDWNQFRPQFEAEASRVIGAPVRVAGQLDALLLPTPTLRLRGVAIGGDKDASRLRADKLDVEFSLGSLMRGELRASELALDGAALDLGLDRQGRIDGSALGGRFNLGSLAIDRLHVKGRLALHDAASGATLRLDDLQFSGDVRALAGTLRGEGAVTLAGARTPFRITTGQTGDGRGTRLRLSLDPGGRALAADLDGVVTFDAAAPAFEGALTLARPAANGADAALPWRLTSRLKATPAAAAFEQIEAAYGPEDSALRFTGAGDIRFGASPLLRMALAARQLDADRLLGAGGPVPLIPALRRMVAALPAAPLPSQIEIGAEQIAFGGRSLQNIAIELRGDPSIWNVAKFELRAPGGTRIAASGTVAAARFTGPLTLDAADPELLAAWLQGRSDAAYRNQKPLRLRGTTTIAPDALALDDLKAELDGGAIEGRLALLTPDGGAARFEAALAAPRFDLDAATTLIGTLAGPRADWPAEAQISLEAGSATIAGQEMRPAAVRFAYGPAAVTLEHLQLGDAAKGVALSGSGAFDRGENSGRLTLTAAAPALAQIGALLAPLAPAVAERIDAAASSGTARVQVTAEIGKAARDARAVVDIDAPQLKGSATLTATPAIDALHRLDLAEVARSPFTVETRLHTDRTAVMLALLGLDRVASAHDGPAQFEGSIAGTWRAPLRLKARLAGAGFDGEIEGSGNPWAEQPAAEGTVAIREADLAALFGLEPASVAALGIGLKSRVALAGDSVTLEGIDGTIGGARVRGRLVLTRGEEIGVDGEVGFDKLDLAGVAGLAFGAAGHDASEPLHRGWLRGWRGRLAFEALSAPLPGGAELRPFGGTLRGDGQSLVLENAKGGLGGGEATLALDARQAADGTAFNARVQLSGADGAALRYRGLALPPGQAALQMTLAGHGRSAAGLAGALSGAGALTLTDARIAGLDPRAFQAAIRASDAGQAADDQALEAVVAPALSAGTLTVPSAQLPFIVKDGRLRVEAATLEAGRARLAIAGGYDVLADQADLRAVMSPLATRPISGRPEIRIDWHGTPDRLSRTLDVAALSSWLAIRAIDRETRRLDQLERGGTAAPDESDELWDEPLPQVEPLPPSQVKLPHRDPRKRGQKDQKERAKAAPPPVAPAPSPQAVIPPPHTAPPLPPPIDIRPAPGALRAPKARPATPPASGTL
jgi:large subunit ribosomal protein L24